MVERKLIAIPFNCIDEMRKLLSIYAYNTNDEPVMMKVAIRRSCFAE